MGNSQSTSTIAPVEQVVRPQEPSTSVQVSRTSSIAGPSISSCMTDTVLSSSQFAPSLLTQLTSSSSDQTNASSSSNHHDPVILSRLQAEVSKLRSEEAQILKSISSALEKENLDRDRGSTENSQGSLNSVTLSRDLEDVREKVERMMGKRAGHVGAESSEVETGRASLVQCYL